MSKPNIVVIAVDTLRADHLSCYGYQHRTSPWIDQLAGESVVFDAAFAAGIPTTPSFTSLFTGLHPVRTGITNHPAAGLLGREVKLLPELAKAAGYVTVASDNLVVTGGGRGSWFARGYDYYSSFRYSPAADQSRDLTDRSIRMLEGLPGSDEPFFLFVHYWDPHTPYLPAPPYQDLHYAGPVDQTDFDRVRTTHADYYDPFLADMGLTGAIDYGRLIARYDGSISQADHQIGRLLEFLASLPRWDETIVVLLSDHGECFGEGGLYFDHAGLDDAVTRLAMMIRIPGQAPRRISSLVSNEDVLPTLGDLAGLPRPDYPLTGLSLRDLLEGRTETVRDHVVSVECTRQATVALRTPGARLVVPIVEDVAGGPVPDVYGDKRSREPELVSFGENSTPAALDDLMSELDRWAVAEGHDAATRVLDPCVLSLPHEAHVQRLSDRLGRGR